MSTPVKAILGIIIVAIIGLGAGLLVRQFSKPSVYDTSDFAWGVTVLPFPFPQYTESFTGTQIKDAAGLGINYIRVDYIPFNPKTADVAIEAATKQGLRTVLVIPFGPKDIFTNKSLEKDTEAYVSEIVNRFKGKVGVYQLATESASVALANNGAVHGIDLKDYPAARLNAVTTWVKTANETVKKIDPQAKTLVNDQWVHTGFFDNYFEEGGDFDILGWNWFSDMGTSMETVTIDASKDQTYALREKLASYNKPIWLTEVNRRLGSSGGNEKAQAEFISTIAKYAKTQSSIQGFFVYNYLEDQAAPEAEKGYSIVTATNSNGDQKITGHKQAYDAYKKAIKED